MSDDLTERVGRLSPARQAALLARLTAAGPASAELRSPTREQTVPVAGPVALLPAQRILLDQLDTYGADPNLFAISSLVHATRPLRPDHLATALARLVEHHEALRLRYTRTGEGWAQEVVASVPATAPRLVDLADEAPADHRATIVRVARELRLELDLARGRVLRMAMFRAGPDRPSSLLLVVHHLVADAYAIALLWNDLWSVYEELERGGAGRLPASTSFRRWVERLSGYAGSPALERDARYWRDGRWLEAAPLPAEAAPPDGRGLASLHATLPAPTLRAVLAALPTGTQLPEAVLAALVTALRRWVGADTFVVTVVQHGRAQLLDGVDLTRTVGWLTVHPMVLVELPPAPEFEPVVRTVAEALRRVPMGGIPWEFTRGRVDGQPPAWLDRLQQTRVVFDYLGAEGALPGQLRPAPDDLAAAFDPPHVWGARTLLVAAQVTGGQLQLKVTYDRRGYPTDAVATVLGTMTTFLRTASVSIERGVT